MKICDRCGAKESKTYKMRGGSIYYDIDLCNACLKEVGEFIHSKREPHDLEKEFVENIRRSL